MKSILNYYKYVTPSIIVTQPIVPKEPKVETVGNIIQPDAVKITLVEYDLDTKNYITAHRMKDYRRQMFKLNLLPDITTLFDKLLEGGAYWNAKLQNEGSYDF